ncbi:MAG: hypothetical protein J7L39_03485, partial [Candidatus Aenigmarchaeota archaeon]|nr:hypothetical protein [Candidatus Aenigmarchaeota archaeon]
MKGRKLFLTLSSTFFGISLTLLLLVYLGANVLSSEFIRDSIDYGLTVFLNKSQIRNLEETLPFVKMMCEGKEYLNISEIISGLPEFRLNCSLVKESKSMRELIVNSVFESVYYKNYKCELISCLREGEMLYFISYQFYN